MLVPEHEITEHEITEREITEPVALCGPDGRLNRDAVGWTRRPLHGTDDVGRGWRAQGRTKRWEYWAVTTPTHVVAMTISDIDYAGVHQVWVLDRRTGTEVDASAIVPLARGVQLPGTLGEGPARVWTRALRIGVDEVPGGTRLRAVTDRVQLDVVAELPDGHEALGVVVPWSDRLFQYTVKDVARPARGRLRVDGVEVELPEGGSWAVLDHGRGRWPYAMHWNWGAASGESAGAVVGLQLGGRWTVGTGTTENAVVVDGRLHKISEELTWDYDPGDWLAPWRVHGSRVDVRFTPFHDRVAVTDLGVFASRTHQCFGHYDGWALDDADRRVEIRGLLGWAEDVHNRW